MPKLELWQKRCSLLSGLCLPSVVRTERSRGVYSMLYMCEGLSHILVLKQVSLYLGCPLLILNLLSSGYNNIDSFNSVKDIPKIFSVCVIVFHRFLVIIIIIIQFFLYRTFHTKRWMLHKS